MREITSETELVSADGHLIPEAIGFSRRPLHTTEHLPHGLLHGFHTKKWERWIVTTDDVVLALTMADLDLGALVRVFCLDRATGQEVAQERVRIPCPRESMVLPGSAPPFFAHSTLDDVSVRFDAAGENRTVLRAETERISTVLEVDARTESLSMVLPLGRDRFRYSVLGAALPVSGLVVLDGKDLPVEGAAFANLDRGRGRMPRRTESHRASGCGIAQDGTRLGLVLTDVAAEGSDASESALVLDGVLDGPRPPVTFTGAGAETAATAASSRGGTVEREPWRIRGSWIDATLTPWHAKTGRTKVGPVREEGLQVFGTFSGTARTGDGREVSLDGLTGWAERAARRW